MTTTHEYAESDLEMKRGAITVISLHSELGVEVCATDQAVVPALSGWWWRHWSRTKYPGYRGGRHAGRWVVVLAGLAPLVAPDNATEIRALEADSGEYLGYVRSRGPA